MEQSSHPPALRGSAAASASSLTRFAAVAASGAATIGAMLPPLFFNFILTHQLNYICRLFSYYRSAFFAQEGFAAEAPVAADKIYA